MQTTGKPWMTRDEVPIGPGETAWDIVIDGNFDEREIVPFVASEDHTLGRNLLWGFSTREAAVARMRDKLTHAIEEQERHLAKLRARLAALASQE